ncbi:MAG: TIR domain-containing protein [Pseudomonadota bacterium]
MTTPRRTDDGSARDGRGRAHTSVFVSYARQDHERVRQVVDGLRLLAADVWLDESLVAGEAWWEEILEHIRACDVFVQTLSTAALKSPPCESERRYAAALGKPILPVALERVPPSTLPGDLAGLQFVNYSEATPESAFRLARALESMHGAPPLPDPLPEPPPVPFSYLVALGDKVRAPHGTLTLDDQLAIAAQLRGAIEQPDDLDAAEALLHELRARRDLFAVVGSDVDRTLAEIAVARSRAASDGAGDRVAAATSRPAHASGPVAVERPREPPDTREPAVTEAAVTGRAEREGAAQGVPPAAHVSPRWPMAVISAFVFIPVGVFAIVSAARVGPALARGDIAEAAKASSLVRTLFWVSIAAFVVLLVIATSTSPS